MDFSKLQGLIIPEGVVTEITDAIGNVLWSASKLVAVTIKSKCQGINGTSARLTIRSSKPFAPDPSHPDITTTLWTVEVWEEPNVTIELPTGSTIECYVSDSKQSNRCFVCLNGADVLMMPGTYNYTVIGDVYITMKDYYQMGEYGEITIDEGVEFFTVNGKQYAFRSGQTWAEWFGSNFDDGYLGHNGWLVYVNETFGSNSEYGYDYADCLYYPDGTYTFVGTGELIQPITYEAYATTI